MQKHWTYTSVGYRSKQCWYCWCYAAVLGWWLLTAAQPTNQHPRHRYCSMLITGVIGYTNWSKSICVSLSSWDFMYTYSEQATSLKSCLIRTMTSIVWFCFILTSVLLIRNTRLSLLWCCCWVRGIIFIDSCGRLLQMTAVCYPFGSSFYCFNYCGFLKWKRNVLICFRILESKQTFQFVQFFILKQKISTSYRIFYI
jgi:hypothetical protein